MNTDVEWEKWGARDPYYGVLTNEKFRVGAMTPEARAEFFEHGRWHADYVLRMCRTHLTSDFAPRRVLDFGCGVGRVLIPFATTAEEVVGVDVSSSMLSEARRNCELSGMKNVKLVASDDALSRVEGSFDLVHSWIVIQHIGEARGLRLVEKLLNHISPWGIGAIHVTFAWDLYQENYGVEPHRPPPPPATWRQKLRRSIARVLRRHPAPPLRVAAESEGDPEMQMNFYNLSQLTFLLHRAGIHSIHTELTDHGGALGAFLFFRKQG